MDYFISCFPFGSNKDRLWFFSHFPFGDEPRLSLLHNDFQGLIFFCNIKVASPLVAQRGRNWRLLYSNYTRRRYSIFGKAIYTYTNTHNTWCHFQVIYIIENHNLWLDNGLLINNLPILPLDVLCKDTFLN